MRAWRGPRKETLERKRLFNKNEEQEENEERDDGNVENAFCENFSNSMARKTQFHLEE